MSTTLPAAGSEQGQESDMLSPVVLHADHVKWLRDICGKNHDDLRELLVAGEDGRTRIEEVLKFDGLLRQYCTLVTPDEIKLPDIRTIGDAMANADRANGAKLRRCKRFIDFYNNVWIKAATAIFNPITGWNGK